MNCKICGQPFERTGRGQKYCKPCAILDEIEYQKAYQKHYRKGNRHFQNLYQREYRKRKRGL